MIAVDQLLEAVKQDYSIKVLTGTRPQIIIGQDRTITNLIIHYCGGEPDWKEPVYLQILEDDEESVVRVLRSMDIPRMEVVIF